MAKLWPLGLLWVCGLLISVQATINVAFNNSLGRWLFAFVFTVVQLVATGVALLIYWLASGRGAFGDALAGTPGWQYFGGALGLPLLVGMAYGLGRTGTLAGFIALVAGQMIMGLLIDHFGWLAAPQYPVTWARVGGVALVLVGLFVARVEW